LSASGVSPAEIPVAKVFQPVAAVVVETSEQPEVREIPRFDVDRYGFVAADAWQDLD